MADGRIDKLIESLEASFDAGIARAEDEAASDLAFSLLQGATLLETLAHEGPYKAQRACGAQSPIVEVGQNYVRCGSEGDILVPASALVASTAPDGPLPRLSGDTLLSVLRGHARRGGRVEVVAGGLTVTGRLARAAVDHLVVTRPDRSGVGAGTNGPGSDVLVAVGAVTEVRLPATDGSGA